VILANPVAVAGHAEVGDAAVLGGMVGLHQFVRVGKMAMIGAGAMVPLDIPPFCLAWGDRAQLNGLNLIGLRRRGYTASDVAALKKAYRDLFSSTLPVAEQLVKMSQESPSAPVTEMLEFLKKSARGFCRPGKKTSAEEA
jgi:UDP-N-acetylglucosamine acyltransferase